MLVLCGCVIHFSVAALPELFALRLCLAITELLGTHECSAEDLLVGFSNIIHQAPACTAEFVL